MLLLLPNMLFSCCTSTDDVSESKPSEGVTVHAQCRYDQGPYFYETSRGIDIEDLKKKAIKHFKLQPLGEKDLALYSHDSQEAYYENCFCLPGESFSLRKAFNILMNYNIGDGKPVNIPFSVIEQGITSPLSVFTDNAHALLFVESTKMPGSPVMLLANQKQHTFLDVEEVACHQIDNEQQTVKFHVYEKMPVDMICVDVSIGIKQMTFAVPKQTTVGCLKEYLAKHFFGSSPDVSRLILRNRAEKPLQETDYLADRQPVIAWRTRNPVKPR